MPRTKKLGRVARFGARYGSKLKALLKRIEDREKAKHKCPRCGALKVRRIAVGIWQCKKCTFTFAGGAYVPQTTVGKAAMHTIKRFTGESS